MTENSVVTVNTAGSNTTEIVLFNNPNFGQIRTMMIDEEPWFVGKDVANKLGYQNGSRDINRHVDKRTDIRL